MELAMEQPAALGGKSMRARTVQEEEEEEESKTHLAKKSRQRLRRPTSAGRRSAAAGRRSLGEKGRPVGCRRTESSACREEGSSEASRATKVGML